VQAAVLEPVRETRQEPAVREQPATQKVPPAAARQEPAPQTLRREPAAPQKPPPAVKTAQPRAPRQEPVAQPTSQARTLPPERTPQGTRQLLPAEPQGTEAPSAPRESTPYVPQTFSQPLPEQGPVQAAAVEPQQPSSVLDTGALDRTLERAPPVEAGAAGVAAAADSRGGRSGPRAAPAASSQGGFEIAWDNPEQGREALYTPEPLLPDEAKQGQELRVQVSFRLTPQGLVTGVEVKRSSGYPAVDAAVQEAFRRWRFTPVPDGAPEVRGETTYRIMPR
jgi:protein TonB